MSRYRYPWWKYAAIWPSRSTFWYYSELLGAHVVTGRLLYRLRYSRFLDWLAVLSVVGIFAALQGRR